MYSSDAGSGANAIKAAYHLLHALEGLEEEWNARAKSDAHYRSVNHPINFNPGIIRGGDWASSVPAWCDVECRLAVLPGWSVAACQEEIVACINGCNPAMLNTCVPACIGEGSANAQAAFLPLQNCSAPACYNLDAGIPPCATPSSAACMTCLSTNCSTQLNNCLMN